MIRICFYVCVFGIAYSSKNKILIDVFTIAKNISVYKYYIYAYN